MEVLITGINGFIGRHLALALVNKGHKVFGIGREEGGVLNEKLIDKAVRNSEVVIHLAALTSHKDIVDNKFETLETNFIGTKNVLNAFIKSKTARKFLYASTGKVYGKIVRLPIPEEHPTDPLNILGKSKLITERLIDFYASSSLGVSSKEFIILRIFNVYGRGQKDNFLIPTILKQLESGNELVLGDIKAKRDYVYIDDVVDGFVRAIQKRGLEGLSIYNICSGKSFSAQEIVEMISQIKGVKIKIKSDSKKIRKDEVDDEYGSFKKAKKVLGWVPKVTLSKGLLKILEKSKIQAVIMAGGKGTRMYKDYPNVPKLLIPLKGKPLIDYLIEYLMRNGVNDIIICGGFLGDKVKEYIRRKNYGVKIRLSIEGIPLGTGGALNSVKRFLAKDFFLIYGDVYTDMNLQAMFDFHKKHKALVTAAIHPSVHPTDSDLVEFNRGFRVTRIFKKPHKRIPNHPYNLAAAYLLNEKIKKYLLSQTSYDFVHDLLPKLIDENLPIYGYNTKEIMADIGTPDRLKRVEKLLQ